jgi:hypothetical protein
MRVGKVSVPIEVKFGGAATFSSTEFRNRLARAILAYALSMLNDSVNSQSVQAFRYPSILRKCYANLGNNSDGEFLTAA